MIWAKLYRWILSPFLHTLMGTGFGCRFEPSCSHYAEQALSTHGWFRGVFLALRRLSRCHPWSKAPYSDPVPPRTQSCYTDAYGS